MEEVKITPEESDMLLHGREYKPGEEGELTDTGERITFPMSEAALSSIEEGRRLAAEHEAAGATENVSDLDTEKRAYDEYIIENRYKYAKEALKHYYNLLREKAGIPYSSECDYEIEGVIDAIREATELQIELALIKNKVKENGGNHGKAD